MRVRPGHRSSTNACRWAWLNLRQETAIIITRLAKSAIDPVWEVASPTIRRQTRSSISRATGRTERPAGGLLCCTTDGESSGSRIRPK
eukprot:7355819-Pyramimonas_sp.AAC.1